MPGILYSVIATFPDEATRAEYIAWLEDGHVDQVIGGGAHSAMIVRTLEPAAPLTVETRYVFSTRELYDRYVRETAPRLREEGLRRFPPERGVAFQRRLGAIV
jgi:hypothetical protein